MFAFDCNLFNPERTLVSLSNGDSEFNSSTLAALSCVDVDGIRDGVLQESTDFWCSAVSYARSSVMSGKLQVSDPFVHVLLRLCKVAAEFAKRHGTAGGVEADVVNALIGSASNMANGLKTPVKLPVSKSHCFKTCDFAILMASKFDINPISVEKIVQVGMYLASKGMDLERRFKGAILPSEAEFNEISAEVIEKLIEFDTADSLLDAVAKLPDVESPMTFLVLRYLYEWRNGYRVENPICCSDFYSRMMSCLASTGKHVDMDRLLPVFVFVSGDSVPVPPEFKSNMYDGAKLFAALALSGLTNSIVVRGKLARPVPENIVLLAVKNDKRRVLDQHVNDVFGTAMDVMAQMMEVDARIFGWIDESMKCSVPASRNLLRHPECLRYLKPECCRFHKLVSVLLDKEVQLPQPTNISIVMAAVLLRMRQLKVEPPTGYIVDIVKSAHAKLRSLTEQMCGYKRSKTELMFAGFSWPGSTVKVASLTVRSPSDYISSAADNSFESITLTLMTILTLIDSNSSAYEFMPDFALHYALGDKLKLIIENHFSDAFAAKKRETRKNHVLSAFEDYGTINDTMSILWPFLVDDVDLTEAITELFVREVKKFGVGVFEKVPRDALNAVNSRLRLDVLEVLVRHNVTDAAAEHAASLFSANDDDLRNSVFIIMGRMAPVSAAAVLAIFRRVEHDLKNIGVMIEAMPSFSGRVPHELASLIDGVIGELPAFGFVNHSALVRKERGVGFWAEDNCRVERPKSLWADAVASGAVYTAVVPGHPVKKTVSANALARLFISLANSGSVEEQPQRVTVGTPVSSIDLSTLLQSTVVKRKYSLVPVNKHVSVLDAKAVADGLRRTENMSRLTRRVTVSPYKVSAVAGEYLVVADASKLRSFKMDTFEEAGSIDLPILPLELSLCPIDPNVIAVASMRRVIIYTLSGDGNFVMMNEIELMLDAIGPNIFVNSIHWVPMAPLHLAVVCSSFVKIYDVPSDCFAPIACFVPQKGTDIFTSAVFVQNGNECIALLALSSGQIAVQAVESSDVGSTGEKQLRCFLSMASIPIQPILSYCEESDLIFITAPGAVVRIMRLHQLLECRKPQLDANVGTIPGEMVFVGTLPSNKGVHVMVHPNSGSLVGIEVTETNVEVFAICDEYPRQPVNPLTECRASVLSTFQTGGQFYAIESSGAISALRYGTLEVDEVVDEPFGVADEFWTASNVIVDNVSMKAPNVKDNCRLYAGEELTLTGVEKVVEISATGGDNLFVGFKVATNHAPVGAYVVLQGRRTPLADTVFLPLRYSEVRSRATYKLEFFGGDITVSRIDVFSVTDRQFRAMTPPAILDWQQNAMNLYDFKEESGRFGSELQRLCSRCSMSIVTDTTGIDSSLVCELVRMIYTVPDLSNVARSVLCRSTTDQEQVACLWAETLSQMIKASQVPACAWSLVWRDHALMPTHAKSILADSLWQNSHGSKGVGPFIAAFLA